MDDILKVAEDISLFCRLHMNTKIVLPIRSSEMGLLIYLVMHDGEKTPMAAARFFKVSKAMITNMVTSLMKQDYIEKVQSTNDKRSFLLIPTKKASQLVEETYEDYFKTMSTLRRKMGQTDFMNMVDLIKKANEILLEVKENG